MEKTLRVEFPLDYTLKNAEGGKTPVHILGKSDNLIRYSTADGAIHNRLISTLTKAEQAMLEYIKTNQSDVFPVEFNLHTKNEKTLPVLLTSKNSEYIQYRLPADLQTDNLHLYPISEISPEEQPLVQELRPRNEIDHSLNCVITDQTGRNLKVKILSRSDDMVKFVADSDNKTYLYPITNLSEMDKVLVESLPDTLADIWKLPELSASVQTARLQIIDLNKKIADLQNRLTLGSTDTGRRDITDFDSTTGALARERSEITSQIQYYQGQEARYRAEISSEFQTRIAQLQAQNIELEGKIRNSSLTKEDQIALQDKILKNVDEARLLKKAYSDVAGSDANPSAPVHE